MGCDSRSRSRGGADEGQIQAMVDERQQCRRDRDFDEADKIRDELRDLGVRVNDAELTWEGSGGTRGRISNGKGGGGGGKGGGNYRGDHGGDHGGDRGGRSGNGGDHGGDRGGRSGNDLSAKMNDKLDEWVAAKRQRDFEIADRLRAEMKEDGLRGDPAEYRPPPGKGGGGKGGGGGSGRRDSRDRGGRRGGGRSRRDSRDRGSRGGRHRDDSRDRGRR